MGAAVPSDHFATATANTRIGGAALSAWDGAFDDKNQLGPEKTGGPDAASPPIFTVLERGKEHHMTVRCDPLRRSRYADFDIMNAIERRLDGRHDLRLKAWWPSTPSSSARSALGNIDRAAWRFRHSAPLTFGFQNSGQSNAPSSFFPPYRQTRSFLGQLFHSLVLPRPGSSRRWIWNPERRSAPAESQHPFSSSIGRQAPFSNIYPTAPPPSALGTDADHQHQGHDTDLLFLVAALIARYPFVVAARSPYDFAQIHNRPYLDSAQVHT